MTRLFRLSLFSADGQRRSVEITGTGTAFSRPYPKFPNVDKIILYRNR